MYKVEWMNDGEKHLGAEIKDLERAEYLAQAMTQLTGVKHAVSEQDILDNMIQVCYGCGCFYDPQEEEIKLVDDHWLCIGCQEKLDE